MALTSALALTAACAAGGLVWATAQHPGSRTALSSGQTSALGRDSVTAPLPVPPGMLVVLATTGSPGISSRANAAQARIAAAGQSLTTSTPDDTSLPSPRSQTSKPPFASNPSWTQEDTGSFDAQRKAPNLVQTALQNDADEGLSVRESTQSWRGGRLYAQPAAQSDPSINKAELRSAVPVVVHQSGLEAEFLTAEVALGDALHSAGVSLQEGDSVSPSLETPVHPGLHVFVRHSTPVNVEVGGTAEELRTLAGTVGEALDEHGIVVGNHDRIEPAQDTPIEPAMLISVVRVERETVIEQEILDFQVERRPDPELAVGQQRFESGQEGLLRRHLEVVRENGEEASRNIVREWVEAEPQTGVVYYGTKRVVQDLDTPDLGELQYTRSMSVYSTWYNASHGDKPRSSPWYGITATGMRAGRGVVAVDPTVIPLHTRMYIPGYGMAVAGDTGGLVKGAHVDLGFEEDEISPWRTGWITIYILD